MSIHNDDSGPMNNILNLNKELIHKLQTLKEEHIQLQKKFDEVMIENKQPLTKNEALEREINSNAQENVTTSKIETRSRKKIGINPFIDYTGKKPKMRNDFIVNTQKLDADVYGIGITFTNRNQILIFTENVNSPLVEEYKKEIQENLIEIRTGERTDEGKLSLEV
jgi:hypothetical protein